MDIKIYIWNIYIFIGKLIENAFKTFVKNPVALSSQYPENPLSKFDKFDTVLLLAIS